MEIEVTESGVKTIKEDDLLYLVAQIKTHGSLRCYDRVSGTYVVVYMENNRLKSRSLQ